MKDWISRSWPIDSGVAPPQAGEAIIAAHPVRAALAAMAARLPSCWAASALIIWLYRQRGQGVAPSTRSAGRLRICLVLLAGVHALRGGALGASGPGLPYLTIMIDDSASERIADQYDKPETQAALQTLASQAAAPALPSSPAPAPADGPAADVTRLDDRQGADPEGQGSLAPGARKAAQGPALPGLELRPAAGRGGPARRTSRRPSRSCARCRADRQPDRGSGDGIRQVLTELRGAPPSAIVLLTDGQTTEGEPLAKAAELAARKGVPLFTIGLGSAEPARDLELTELLVDDVVFVDDAVRFQAKLLARGFQGQKVVVRLKERDAGSRRPQGRSRARLHRGRSPRRRPAQAGRAGPPAQDHGRAHLHPGGRAPARASSRSTTTGSSAWSPSARRSSRSCYVDSEPRYEFRYLKNYLERDETIDLNVVLLSSDPEYSEQDRSALPTFPAAKDELFAYDVVIVGDADTSFLSHSQMQNLVEFVTEKGGGVLFVAGELVQPAGLSGNTAGAAAADRAGRCPQPDGRGQRASIRTAPS